MVQVVDSHSIPLCICNVSFSPPHCFLDSPLIDTPAEVLQLFQERMARQRGVPTLGYLSDLEKKMAEHFKVKDFPRLAQGNFLEFLVKHSEASHNILNTQAGYGGSRFTMIY